MATLRISGGELHLNLTRADTYLWARRRGAAWPYSIAAGRRLYFCLNRDLDITEYSDSARVVPAIELRAIVNDFVKKLAGELLSR